MAYPAIVTAKISFFFVAQKNFKIFIKNSLTKASYFSILLTKKSFSNKQNSMTY